MAWVKVDVKINGKDWGAMMKSSDSSLIFSVSCASELGVGDAIECGGEKYKAVKVTDVAHRGETFLVETEGNTNGKSKARRVRDNSGEDQAQSEGDA